MSLKELDLHVTNKCSLRCKHCVFSSGDRAMKEMNLKEIFKLINDFSKITKQKGTINLFGGEVLLRKDVFDIISKIKEKGLSVGITSNCNVPDEVIDRLLEEKIDRFTSDLDGGIAETHDWLRNMDGNFDKVVNTLKKFVDKNIYTTVNSVLYKDNIDQVIPILELCEKLKINGLAFYYLTPTGRGFNIKGKIVNSKEWIKTKKIVLDWLKNNSPSFTIYWEEAYELVDDPLNIPRRCEKEHDETIFVRCDGEVYSCALLEAAPCSFGNIIKEKLEVILNKRKEKAFLHCDGCPALAYYKHKDLFKSDPRISSKGVKLGCPYSYRIIYEK